MPIEDLSRRNIRKFFDWVHERAFACEGTNPGRIANQARQQIFSLRDPGGQHDDENATIPPSRSMAIGVCGAAPELSTPAMAEAARQFMPS
ncbi:MAG TPA: hypothetical protein VIK18_03250 [Pirellulales bacterium]